MRNSIVLASMLSVATIVLFVGCSLSGSQVEPIAASGGPFGQSIGWAARDGTRLQLDMINQGKSWMKRVDVNEPLTYVSEHGADNAVTVFDRKANVVGKLTGFVAPAGLFVDGGHDLWVADVGGHDILEFPRGGTSPIKKLHDPGYFPTDVTICPNGTVYVSNTSDGSFPSGNVVGYASGSVKPTSTLVWPEGQGADNFLTCDANNNVFTTLFFDFSLQSGVVEYAGGSESGATLLPINLYFPAGIKADNAGNLLLVQNSSVVTEFTEAGTPTGIAMYTSQRGWYGIALTRDGKVIIGTDDSGRQARSSLFPSGVHLQTYTGHAHPSGVAFDPGQNGI